MLKRRCLEYNFLFWNNNVDFTWLLIWRWLFTTWIKSRYMQCQNVTRFVVFGWNFMKDKCFGCLAVSIIKKKIVITNKFNCNFNRIVVVTKSNLTNCNPLPSLYLNLHCQNDLFLPQQALFNSVYLKIWQYYNLN